MEFKTYVQVRCSRCKRPTLFSPREIKNQTDTPCSCVGQYAVPPLSSFKVKVFLFLSTFIDRICNK